MITVLFHLCDLMKYYLGVALKLSVLFLRNLGGIPGSRFSENSELFNPENRQTPRLWLFPFQKER